MRKIITALVVMVLVMGIGIAYATQDVVFVDFQTSTDEELQTIINQIASELENRDYSVDITIRKNVESSFDPSNSPMMIEALIVDEINSVGGVTIKIAWKNTSGKNMKYVVFYVVPYNRVGDAVYSDVGSRSKIGLKITGPVGDGFPYYYQSALDGDYIGASTWKNVWYNNTVSTFKIVSVEITYMDDSVVTLTESDVEKIIKD